MKIKKFREDVKLPKKSHEHDCGLDLFIPDAITIKPFETICVGTGLGFQIPEGFAGIFCPRSSISKKGLIIQTSITDPGYTGETHLIVTNCSPTTYHFEKDDRLCSLVCFSILNPILEEVEEFEKTERGEGGLGSSGK